MSVRFSSFSSSSFARPTAFRTSWRSTAMRSTSSMYYYVLFVDADWFYSFSHTTSLRRVRPLVTFKFPVTQYCVFIGFARVVKLIKRSTGFFLGVRFSYYPPEQQNNISCEWTAAASDSVYNTDLWRHSYRPIPTPHNPNGNCLNETTWQLKIELIVETKMMWKQKKLNVAPVVPIHMCVHMHRNTNIHDILLYFI